MANVHPKGRPLIVGPLPPPVGGIASIVEKLHGWPGVMEKLQFLDSSKKDEGRLSRLARPCRLLLGLCRGLRTHPSMVLAFSSAQGSFWEKSFWLMLCRWYETPMAVMMVDGKFPHFYADLPAPLRKVARESLERFSTVVVQTESWKRFYEKIAPRGNYLVLPNGVDCNEFVPAVRTPTQVPTLLFVGWMIPGKGIFDLLDAVTILKSRQASFVVKLIGPFYGNEPALRARIREVALENCVDVIGEVHSRAKILSAYQSADVFVLPSWAEGLPVAILEAMASGLPIVASAVGGIPDLVEDGISGFLVPPRDPAALAAALEKLIADGDKRSKFGRAARVRVESAFSNEVFIRGVLSLLKA